MTTMKVEYQKTNAVWPDTLPELTDWEAVRATTRLWKYAMGEQCPLTIEATNHGKYSWERRGKFMVVTKRGWHGLIHDLSHYFWWKANPGVKPHSKYHARWEAKLIKEVLKRGWLDGKLQKQEPVITTSMKRVDRLDRVNALIKRWETKQKRAQTALTKLKQERRYLTTKLAA